MSTALPTLPQGPASPWPWPPVTEEPAPAVASCEDAPEPARRRPPKRSPLATMLDEACDWIDRLLVLPSPHARDLFALWAAASGARIDGRLIWSMAPRLALISDDPASAKSLALRILMALSYKGETVEDPS